VQAVCDVVATLYRLKRSLLVLKGDFIGSANNESVHNKEACQIGDLGCAAKPMVDENSECEAARCLLLVRPGSPGSRLARLPGEGGQYVKTSNTQIFPRPPTIDFSTYQNATQSRSY
jgi:hypothetical protein